MKLFDSHLSHHSSRCRMQIYAKGLDLEIISVPGQFTFDELKELSSIGKIPTLEDGQEIFPESAVIAEYLEDVYPDIALRPKGTRSLARMRLISRISDLYISAPLETLFTQVYLTTRNSEAVETGLEKLSQGLDYLERYLDGTNGFAVNSKLTLADCTLVPTLYYVQSMLPAFPEATPLTQWGKTHKYWSTIQCEENSSKILAEMKIAFSDWRDSNQ
ncbi:MAG: glutathione S-transferase family protein [Pseudomonadales bacterium]|nr:glutathione S-transferase family protein [Pseudomonadales bacterium]